MYDLRNLPGYKHLCALGAVLLGALCPFQVEAGPFSSSSSGNSTTYASSAYGGDAAIAGAALVISGGAVYAAQSTTLRTAAGATAALALRAAPAAGAVSGAVLSCFGNPLCVGFVGAAAIAVLAKEVNFDATVDASSGLPVVTKTVYSTDYCYSAPCYQWPLQEGGYTTNKQLAANSYCSWAAAGWATCTHVQTGTTSTIVFTARNSQGQLMAQGSRSGISAPPSAQPGQTPTTVADLATAVGAKNDWADNSKIIDLLEKIVKNTTQKIPLQVPSVTGPTSIPGTPTVTTKADGSKVTTTTSSSLGYYGPRVDVTDTTTVQETTPAGVTTTTSTTTAPTKTEEVAKDEYDVPTDEIPKTKKTITFNAENLGFAGGSCPADVNKVIAGKTVKLVDWTSNCGYVTTYAKPMILAMATFAALMIIFVGGKPE